MDYVAVLSERAESNNKLLLNSGWLGDYSIYSKVQRS